MTKGRGTSRGALWQARTLIMIACCTFVSGYHVEAPRALSDAGVMRCLGELGFLRLMHVGNEEIISNYDFTMAITDLQTYVGLPITGKMNEETAALLTQIGCAEEEETKPSISRTKRYTLLGEPWPKHELTYRIVRYTAKLDKATVDSEIARAFAVWADHANLSFRPVTSNADLKLWFTFDPNANGHGHSHEHGHEHGHGHSHDHPEHRSGRIDFDDSQPWSVNSNTGTDLFIVAVHNIGWALGLGHNYVDSAVMGDVGPYVPNFRLSADDIAGIQALYGAKPSAA